MKRKLTLLLTTFAILLGAFAVYSYVVGIGLGRGDHSSRIDPNRMSPPSIINSGDENAGWGKATEIIRKDEEGRSKMNFRCDGFKRLPDDTIEVLKPRFEIRGNDGRWIYINADFGTLYTEAATNRLDAKRGMLSGNVQVFFDRSTTSGPTPDHERLEDFVRIYTDSVSFDLEVLEISTDDEIQLFSREVDIAGKGLLLLWNESPQELRLLRIKQGRSMSVKNIPEQFNVVSLTSENGKPSVEIMADDSLDDAPTPSQPLEDESIVSVTVAPEPANVSTDKNSDPNMSANIFLASFHEQVHVISSDASIQGADILTLKFEWDNSSRRQEKLIDFDNAAHPVDKAAMPQPPVHGPDNAGQVPLSQPLPTGRQLKITWTGPLEIRPDGYTDSPSNKRYEVSGKGDCVVLTDKEATAICHEFNYRRPQGDGELVGTEDAPVMLLLGSGEVARCRNMAFSTVRQSATLIGPGKMISKMPLSTDVAETRRAFDSPAGDWISWEDSVRVRFGRLDAKPSHRADDRRRTFVKDARFSGNVLLTRPSRGNQNDRVRCNELRVWMSPGNDKRISLTRAVAIGSVDAHWSGDEAEFADLMSGSPRLPNKSDKSSVAGNIAADKMTITFSPAPTGSSDVVGAVRPKFIVAEGNVHLVEDRPERPVEAFADRLVTSPSERTATLYGREGIPAWIKQGNERIEGQELFMRRGPRRDDNAGEKTRSDDYLQVRSHGELSFLLDKDLNGKKLSESRKVKISWRKQMEFAAADNKAIFTGNVALDSGPDQARGDVMEVFLEDLSKPKDDMTENDSAETDNRFGSLKISRIRLEGDVTASMAGRDEQGQLIRRLYLEGESFDINVKDELVDGHGKGALSVEDYRPPEPDVNAINPAEAGGTSLDRPSRSAFSWTKIMSLSQATREVILKGDAVMVHRSGRYISLSESVRKQLNVPAWPKVSTGRITAIKCNQMSATFDEPNDDAKSGGGRMEGPGIGNLRSFYALGDVGVEDGDREKRTIHCQQLQYDRHDDGNDVVKILGYLPDQKPQPARMYLEKLDRNTPTQSWVHESMTWYRGSNKVIIHNIGGGG